MLASLVDAPLTDPQFVYEPKYDGIRAIAEIGPRVRLWSRLGNEKTAQFPEVVTALQHWARRRKLAAVLDGEIVALGPDGQPVGFQGLQGRIHEQSGRAGGAGTAYIVFDVLREGRNDLRGRPLHERRAVLERLLGKSSLVLRVSEQVRGDGRALYERALAEGWEGLIAKDAASVYESGKRTPSWRKLKIVHEQEFVIGGWTEPRHTRSYFGALLLGVHDQRREDRPSAGSADSALKLTYVGHTGTGFDEKELARVMARLKELETRECPFDVRPKANQPAHWVRPELVAAVKFTEWTADGKLRHPVYLGLRDDKDPREVIREPELERKPSRRSRPRGRLESGGPTGPFGLPGPPGPLLDQLTELERSRKSGVLHLPDGTSLTVGNLHKVFWPKQKLTKGDLFRYYVRVAPYVLPAVTDRPLVMKRFPNGVAGAPFYQHRVEDAPRGVRVEMVSVAERRPQLIGGALATLLYMTQLAAVSQDPWFSRVQAPEFPDYAALDLDPPDGAPFARVLDVARWIRDELDALGAVGVPKTSGASGLHIYIPLPPKTPYDAGLLLCQIVATVVARKHPRAATVERSVRARGSRVYVDYLQNALGKTLATAYSARASEYAGVSTPVSWKEVDDGFRREAFTIETVPARIDKVGDLWQTLRTAKPVDFARVERYARDAGLRLKA